MTVVCERNCESLFLHNQKTGAISQTPALISHVVISLQCALEKPACLGNDSDLGCLSKRYHRLCRRLAKTRPVIAKAVQELSQNHFAGHDLVGAVVLRN